MTRSPGPEPNPRTLHDEAAAAAVRDTGPTPDRYYNALLHYLQAMSHDRLAARPDPAPARPDPAPRLRPATLVGDVMTEEVVTAHEGAVFKEIVAALARNKIRAVPVIDDNRKVIGVVSASDLLHRVVAGPGTRPRTSRAPQSAHADTAAELMTTPAVTTRPTPRSSRQLNGRLTPGYALCRSSTPTASWSASSPRATCSACSYETTTRYATRSSSTHRGPCISSPHG